MFEHLLIGEEFSYYTVFVEITEPCWDRPTQFSSVTDACCDRAGEGFKKVKGKSKTLIGKT